MFEFSWFLRKDLIEVADIEFECFEFPYTTDEIIEFLKNEHKNTIARVARYEGKVVGYIFYEVKKDSYFITNLAIAHEFRRQGIAKQFISEIIAKLNPDRRIEISTRIRETNVSAQLFMKKMGFEHTHTETDSFQEIKDENSYIMTYKIKQKQLQ